MRRFWFGLRGALHPLCVALLVGLWPSPGGASLEGDTVHYELISMEMVASSADFVVVLGTIEIVDRGLLEVDVEADTITLTVAPPLDNVGFGETSRIELSDLDWADGGIGSVAVDFADAMGFDPGGVTFSATSVEIELGDVVLESTGFIEVTLPEPVGAASALAALASLLALGLPRAR